MQVHGSLDLQGNYLRHAVLPSEVNFPEPIAGMMIFRNKQFYFCAEVVEGVGAWIPASPVIDSVVYTQSVPALEWTIPHNLDSAAVLVQVYVDGKWVIPQDIDTSVKNVVNVTFSMSVAGQAIVMLGNPFGSQRPAIGYTQGFNNQTTVVVTHNLGYNPVIQVLNDAGQELAPASVVHNSTLQATLTFAAARSGTVRCI